MSWTLRDSICVHYFCGRCPLGTSRNPFHKSCHKMNQSEIIESIKKRKTKRYKNTEDVSIILVKNVERRIDYERISKGMSFLP